MQLEHTYNHCPSLQGSSESCGTLLEPSSWPSSLQCSYRPCSLLKSEEEVSAAKQNADPLNRRRLLIVCVYVCCVALAVVFVVSVATGAVQYVGSPKRGLM